MPEAVDPAPVIQPVVNPAPVVPKEAVKKKQKRYTGDRIAPARAYAIRALVESGFSRAEIARRDHVSNNTIAAIEKSDRFDPQRVERIKQGLSAHFYDRVNSALETITQEKLDKSTALQLMTVAAIGTDKARLIEGKATARTEYVDASDQAIDDEIARLEGELTQWKDGQIVNAQGLEEVGTTPEGQHALETVDGGSTGA